MVDKTINTAPGYSAPAVRVVSISTCSRILGGSLGGNLGLNDYNRGSESIVGFGDDEDD